MIIFSQHDTCIIFKILSPTFNFFSNTPFIIVFYFIFKKILLTCYSFFNNPFCFCICVSSTVCFLTFFLIGWRGHVVAIFLFFFSCGRAICNDFFVRNVDSNLGTHERRLTKMIWKKKLVSRQVNGGSVAWFGILLMFSRGKKWRIKQNINLIISPLFHFRLE